MATQLPRLSANWMALAALHEVSVGPLVVTVVRLGGLLNVTVTTVLSGTLGVATVVESVQGGDAQVTGVAALTTSISCVVSALLKFAASETKSLSCTAGLPGRPTTVSV